jgi:hypothetical protein
LLNCRQQGMALRTTVEGVNERSGDVTIVGIWPTMVTTSDVGLV